MRYILKATSHNRAVYCASHDCGFTVALRAIVACVSWSDNCAKHDCCLCIALRAHDTERKSDCAISI